MMLYYYGTWVEDASCRNNADAGPDIWFDDQQRARRICMKCPVNDECLFTAMQLIQQGETVKGIWGGLSAIQLKRAMKDPKLIPKMRGQRSRSKNPPLFDIPPIPEPLYREDDEATGTDDFMEHEYHASDALFDLDDFQEPQAQ